MNIEELLGIKCLMTLYLINNNMDNNFNNNNKFNNNKIGLIFKILIKIYKIIIHLTIININNNNSNIHINKIKKEIKIIYHYTIFHNNKIISNNIICLNLQKYKIRGVLKIRQKNLKKSKKHVVIVMHLSQIK